MVEAKPIIPFPVIMELNTLVFFMTHIASVGTYLVDGMWQEIKSLLLVLWPSHPCL